MGIAGRDAAQLAVLGVGEEAQTGGFLVASFLFYLVIPTLELERRRLARK